MRPSAGTVRGLDNNYRIAHRLSVALAGVCRRVDGPDFGDLIDDALLEADPAALADVMRGAQQVVGWTARRDCFVLDLLGEAMHEFRHLSACLIDRHPVSTRTVSEICRGLLALDSRCVRVQLHGLRATTDALDVADALNELSDGDGLEEAA